MLAVIFHHVCIFSSIWTIPVFTNNTNVFFRVNSLTPFTMYIYIDVYWWLL